MTSTVKKKKKCMCISGDMYRINVLFYDSSKCTMKGKLITLFINIH